MKNSVVKKSRRVLRFILRVIYAAVKESNKKIASEEVDKSDVKTRAKILKSVMRDKAVKYNISMD